MPWHLTLSSVLYWLSESDFLFPTATTTSSVSSVFILFGFWISMPVCLYHVLCFWHYDLFCSCILPMCTHSSSFILQHPLSCPFPPVSSSLCSPTRMWNCSTSCERKTASVVLAGACPNAAAPEHALSFSLSLGIMVGKSKRLVTALSISLWVPFYHGWPVSEYPGHKGKACPCQYL